VVFGPKILGLQYISLLLRFFYVFLKIQKNVTFYVFLLCFTRFLELWRALHATCGGGTLSASFGPGNGSPSATHFVLFVLVLVLVLVVTRCKKIPRGVVHIEEIAIKLCTDICDNIPHKRTVSHVKVKF